MCYLRQPQALCAHCSDVPLTGLDELCGSVFLWLCLTISRFIPTCSAPDMVWNCHVCFVYLQGIVSLVYLNFLHTLNNYYYPSIYWLIF